MSLPELILWRELRAAKHGFKVRRQHPIGPYVVDFYVSAARLVIEVDGEAHNRSDRPLRDSARQAFLEQKGYAVLRVAAVDVLTNLEGVLTAASSQVTSPLHRPSDGPPPHAGEDL